MLRKLQNAMLQLNRFQLTQFDIKRHILQIRASIS